MYVLCSLAVLALHSLFRSWKGGEASRSPEAAAAAAAAAAALGGNRARSKRSSRVQVSRGRFRVTLTLFFFFSYVNTVAVKRPEPLLVVVKKKVCVTDFCCTYSASAVCRGWYSA